MYATFFTRLSIPLPMTIIENSLLSLNNGRRKKGRRGILIDFNIRKNAIMKKIASTIIFEYATPFIPNCNEKV